MEDKLRQQALRTAFSLALAYYPLFGMTSIPVVRDAVLSVAKGNTRDKGTFLAARHMVESYAQVREHGYATEGVTDSFRKAN